MFCGHHHHTPMFHIAGLISALLICGACASTPAAQEEDAQVRGTPPTTTTSTTPVKRIAVYTPPAKRQQSPTRVVLNPSRVKHVKQLKHARMDLDVRDVEVRQVLARIASRGNVNIVTDDDIQGTITISVKSMPLDRLFLTVLQSKQLAYMSRGNIIHVASRSKLKAQVSR